MMSAAIERPALSTLEEGINYKTILSQKENSPNGFWNRWDMGSTTIGVPPLPATDHVSVQLGRKLLVVAGFTNPNNDRDRLQDIESEVFSLDLDTNTWSKHARYSKEVPTPRAGCSAGIYKDSMYIFGGWCRGLSYTNELWRYDIEHGTWTCLGPGPETRVGISWPSKRDKADLVVHNGKLYLFGGWGPKTGISYQNFHPSPHHLNTACVLGWNNDFWEYDIANGTWLRIMSLGNPPQARAAHKMAVLNNSLYVIGGRTSEGRRSDVYRFSFNEGMWRGPLGKMTTIGSVPDTNMIDPGLEWPMGRVWHSVNPIDAHSILVFGGMGTKIVHGREQPLSLGDVWVFNINTETFRKISTCPLARLWHTSCVDEFSGELVCYAGRIGVPQENFQDMRNDVIRFKFMVPTLRALCIQKILAHLPDQSPLGNENCLGMAELKANLPIDIYSDIELKLPVVMSSRGSPQTMFP